MRNFIPIFASCWLGLFLAVGFGQTIELDSDSLMFRSTFKITGGGVSGTAFFLTQQVTNKALVGTNTDRLEFVMVTAAHVLSKMNSSNATIYLRYKDGEGYKKVPFEFPIKRDGTNLWYQHPTMDISVMRPPLQLGVVDISGVPADGLANDKFLNDFKIHPGDELRVLGYPLNLEANDAVFPILRSGRIASYPIAPYPKFPTFLLDFQIFEGNSGGPVYMLERRYMNSSTDSVSFLRIMGLISEQQMAVEQQKGLMEDSVKRHQLGLGVVIHAQAISETIGLLPPR